MLVNIQALVLDTGRNTQAVQFLDSVEEGEATGGSPKVDDEDAEGLRSEETPPLPYSAPSLTESKPVISVPKIPHTP